MLRPYLILNPNVIHELWVKIKTKHYQHNTVYLLYEKLWSIIDIYIFFSTCFIPTNESFFFTKFIHLWCMINNSFFWLIALKVSSYGMSPQGKSNKEKYFNRHLCNIIVSDESQISFLHNGNRTFFISFENVQKTNQNFILEKKNFSWKEIDKESSKFFIQSETVITLLASSTHGIGCPSGNCTLLSKSCFHFETASKVDCLVTSKTIKQPTASL